MRPLLVAALLFGAACSRSPLQVDAGQDAFDLGDFDAAPGTLGATCDHFGGARACGSGLHCTVGEKAGAKADVCIPDTVSPIADGQKCARVALGMGLIGDDCAKGSVCLDYTGSDQCVKLCSVRADCGPTEACSAPTGAPSNAAGCLVPATCDAMLQTGCSAETACYLSRDNVSRVLTCQQTTRVGDDASGVSLNGACKLNRDCAPGLLCTTLGYCRSLCYVVPPVGATKGLCSATEPPCARLAGAPPNYGVCDDP